jgi:hypothetical protein
MDFFKLKTGAQRQGSLEKTVQSGKDRAVLQRQGMQKTVLKRQGSLARTRPAEKCLEEIWQTCKL